MTPEALGKKIRAKNRSYRDAFNTPAGKIVLDDLQSIFKSLIKKAPDGQVDANATLACVGAYSVIQLIKDRIEDGEMAR